MNKYRKALKNYTTNANIDKMIADIQSIILDFGGTGIIFDYDQNRRVKGLMFKIEIDASTRLINVPIFTEKTRGVLEKQGVMKNMDDKWVKNYEKNLLWNDEHAYKVTLANVRDWLDAQLAIYETQMFEFPQIFLPYMTDPATGQTFYDTLKASNYLLQAPGREQKQ